METRNTLANKMARRSLVPAPQGSRCGKILRTALSPHPLLRLVRSDAQPQRFRAHLCPSLPLSLPFHSPPFPSLSFLFFHFPFCACTLNGFRGVLETGGGKKKGEEVVSFTVLISHFRLLIPASQRPLNPTFLGAGRKVRLFSPFLSLHLRSSFSHENPRP